MLVTQTWLRIHESQTISVTGSARRNVRSDLVVWRGTFFAEANTLLEAQRALKADAVRVEQFLTAKGITNAHLSPIGIQSLRSTAKESSESVPRTLGYRLSQNVEVRSKEVDRIIRLDRESVSLVESGVAFTPLTMEFIYTGAGEAKVEMPSKLPLKATGPSRTCAPPRWASFRLLPPTRRRPLGTG